MGRRDKGRASVGKDHHSERGRMQPLGHCTWYRLNSFWSSRRNLRQAPRGVPSDMISIDVNDFSVPLAHGHREGCTVIGWAGGHLELPLSSPSSVL